MGCSQCQSGGANVFGERSAEWLVRRYRKSGPDKTTRMLLDAVRAEGVEGLTLLDIGGGIGVIGLELLKDGVTAATEIEASPAYAAAARSEVRREGAAERVVVREGDFVALAEEVPEAGIVTLDRVICCYPDMPALVGTSAAKAGKLYGAVYPRDTWWMRAGAPVMNLAIALFRNPFRFYTHRTAAVDAVIRDKGLTPRFQRNAGFWQVVVYARPA
jgi:hypothetical protein